MALNTSSRGILGVGLMVVGSLLVLPAMFTGSAPVFNWALIPGILILTLGTWLVGTDIDGEPV